MLRLAQMTSPTVFPLSGRRVTEDSLCGGERERSIAVKVVAGSFLPC